MDLIGSIGVLFPRLTLRYLANRRMLQSLRTYDAAQPSQWRPVMTNVTSGDGVMNATGDKLRQIARQLEENHDLVVAIFDDIVNNTLGDGIRVSPMVRKPDGSLAEDVNDQLSDLWDEWSQSPETTGDFGWEGAERIVFRGMLRDGEQFLQHVQYAPNFRYRTRIPYALELIEADFVPFLYSVADQNILHGVQNNAWNAPIAYYLWKNHPGDPLQMTAPTADQLKRLSAEQVIHLKFVRRLRQRRGVPIIHAVINRLRDLKDYEESERIAAKVAADFTWFIKRTSEYQGPDVDTSVAPNRTMTMSAGMGMNLLPGEDVGTISSDRPNSALVDFREAMLRAVAGGTGTRFSSIARNYNGTYSAQRQELVEGAIAYRAHFAQLVRRLHRPVYQRFVESAMTRGLVQMRGVDPTTISRVDFRAPALPWIDPAKEATAYQTLVTAGLESRQEIMRQRGRDPVKVWEELQQEQASGLFASAVQAAAPQEQKPDDMEDAA